MPWSIIVGDPNVKVGEGVVYQVQEVHVNPEDLSKASITKKPCWTHREATREEFNREWGLHE